MRKQQNNNTTSDDPLFDLALKRLLTIEGGYTDDPNDAGGATNRGVTQREYFKWQNQHPEIYDVKRNGHKSIKAISRDEAAQIYKANYWDVIQADKMPADIAVVVFDTSVNSHPALAMDLLRQMLRRPKATQAQIDNALKVIAHNGQSQQFVDNYLNARWHYVDVYLPRIRPKDLHFQRGWYTRYGMVRDLSADVNQYQMHGTPKNKPLLLGNKGDYVPLEAEHGEFTIYGGDKVLHLPAKNGTYVMLDTRSHYPLMDDKGKVLVFDSAADGYKTVTGGAFVGALDEPGTKPAHPKPGLPMPGVRQPHPGRSNQPPLPLTPIPSPGGRGEPRSTPAPVAAASSAQVNPTPVPHSTLGSLGTDQAAGFAPNPEQHYAAVPQGFGRWSMLHRETHRYLPDPWGNRLYFNSPQEGYRAAGARMNPAAATQSRVAQATPAQPVPQMAAGAFAPPAAGSAPPRTQQIAGVPASPAPAVPGAGGYPAGVPPYAVHPVVAALARAAMMAQAYPPVSNPAMPAVPGSPFAAGQTTG